MSRKLEFIKDWPALAREAKYKVKNLVKLLGIYERELERFFHTLFQVSPSRYLRAIQINAAMELLLKGICPKEVAFDLYFGSVSHFSREFKRHTGFPPKEFVQRKRFEVSLQMA